MPHKLLRPEIESVGRATWNIAKKRWIFWMLVIIAVLFSSFLYLALFSVLAARTASIETGVLVALNGLQALVPFLFPLTYLAFLSGKLNNLFWKQIAEVNKWKYQASGDPAKESGLMFKQGNNHDRNIYNLIDCVVDGRPFRVFNYHFSTGGSKTKKLYFYTVFAFKFDGASPHLYLNNLNNSYSINIGGKIPLPAEFEKKFTLFAPRKYEIEALEVFTPDVLSKILDNNFVHDVEFVDQEVIIFVDGIIDDFEKLEKEFNIAIELNELFYKKLDKFKFHPVGDMSHQLK